MKSRQFGDNVRAPPLCSSTKASKDVLGNKSLCRRDPAQGGKHDLNDIRKIGLTIFIEPRPAQSAAVPEASGELAQGLHLVGGEKQRITPNGEQRPPDEHTIQLDKVELFSMAETGDGTMQPALHMSTDLPQPACRGTSGGRMPTGQTAWVKCSSVLSA